MTETTDFDVLAGLDLFVGKNGQPHSLKLGGTEVKGGTLEGCVLALGAEMGWGRTAEDVRVKLYGMPASSNRDLLIAILEGKEYPRTGAG